MSLPGGRDTNEIEALVTDRYLDTLLAAPTPSPTGAAPTRTPDDDLRSVADRLLRLAPAPPVVPVRGGALGPPDRRGARPTPAGGRRRRGSRHRRCRGDAAAGAIDPSLAAYVAGADDRRRRAREPVAHRRRPHLGGPLAGRGGLRRLALAAAGRDADGPRGPRGRADEADLDAAQAADVPGPSGRLPDRPVDQVPVVRDAGLQQAAGQGASGLSHLRPSLPAVGRGAPRAPARRRTPGRSAMPGSSRSTPSASSTRRRIRIAWRRPRPRPGCAMRPCGVPAPSAATRWRCASWTSGSWAARWARSSGRR